MEKERTQGSKLFDERYPQIVETIDAVARRKRLGPCEAQELKSLVMLKIVDDDFAVLRTFEGRSSWRTYLTVIVLRVLLDERTKRWGRWRPSLAAKRLGTTAIRLDRRINRDGWTAAEAVADLENRCVGKSRAELEALVERIPRRLPRFQVSAEPVLDAEPSPERADRGLEMRQTSRAAKVTRHALGTVLDDLPEAEQRLLELRFAHGWTVKRIAESESVSARPLYSRFERILRRLRQQLLAAGVNWATVAQALGGEAEIDVDFGADPS